MKSKWTSQLRIYLFAAALIGLTSSSVFAQISLPKTGLAGSKHDVSGVGCQGCHAPHNGASANGGPETTGIILLWARSFPNKDKTFGVYSSNTMTLSTAELSNGTALTASTDVRMYSLLCLSCHDGVTSSFSPAMDPKNMVGSKVANGGSHESLGLTNDHPVNMAYPDVDTPKLIRASTVSTTLPLYGSASSVQCSTCHDPHNNVNTNFLRQANNTTHCTTCHK